MLEMCVWSGKHGRGLDSRWCVLSVDYSPSDGVCSAQGERCGGLDRKKLSRLNYMAFHSLYCDHPIALCWIILHPIASHHIASCLNTLFYIILHCIALHCIALHCIALHCIALHCMHCIALHCIALYCITCCIRLHLIASHAFTLQYIALHCHIRRT